MTLMRRQIWGSLFQTTRICYRQMYCKNTSTTVNSAISPATAASILPSIKTFSTTSTKQGGKYDTALQDENETDSGTPNGNGNGNGDGDGDGKEKWIGKTPLSQRLHPNQKNVKLDSQKAIEQFLDVGSSAGARRTGRAWRTSELRLKSFNDLHSLWYILIKERNVLLTEKAWCKTNGRYWTNGPSNMTKVRVSMARVKSVLGERGRAARKRQLEINATMATADSDNDQEVIQSADESATSVSDGDDPVLGSEDDKEKGQGPRDPTKDGNPSKR